MISLTVSSIERIADKRIEEIFKSWNLIEVEDINAYDNLIYIDRRVGFCIVKYFEEYYKLPHHLVPEYKERGDKILCICKDCFGRTIYNSHSNFYHCPRCDLEQ